MVVPPHQSRGREGWPVERALYSVPANNASRLEAQPLDMELQSARSMFGEKVKELSSAVAKVDALTRQLEELQHGNTANSYHVTHNAKLKQDYDKLRSDLLNRRQLITDQSSELDYKKTLLNQKKSELNQLDERIHELHDRLTKKKLLNQAQQQQNALIFQSRQQQQQLLQQHQQNGLHVNGLNTYSSLRRPGILGHKRPFLHPNSSSALINGPYNVSGMGVNIAAVEPIQRHVPVFSCTSGGGDITQIQVSHHHHKPTLLVCRSLD